MAIMMNRLLVRSEKEGIYADSVPHMQSFLPLDIRYEQIKFAEIANQKLDIDSKCEFGLVTNADDWYGIRQLRLKMYLSKRDYLSSLVDRNGIDVYDNHSYLFYAKRNEKYIASVRFTEYPFESSEYFDAANLSAFLGHDYQHHYLEVGRLVADSSAQVNNLSQALLAFSIAMASSIQAKTRYLAYAHPRLKQKAFRFNQEEKTLSFFIPDRRESKYILFKGCLKKEFEALKCSIN